MQEDDHGDDSLGVVERGQVEAVVRQAVEVEALRVGLFLNDEQQRCAPPVGPLDQQRDVELAEALAEALFELLLAQRHDPRAGVDGPGLGGGEEGQGLARVVEDEVLEVLVVAHRCLPLPGSRFRGQVSHCTSGAGLVSGWADALLSGAVACEPGGAWPPV